MDVKPLREDLDFGSRVGGITPASLQDDAVRRELNALFERQGLIVFEDVEPSSRMHVEVSNVFGPLKEHPVKTVERVDTDTMPGVIDMKYDPAKGGMVELKGRRLAQWLPWHFDHCYNNELNRAGVLRAITIPPEGGLTGFVDGVDLYRSLSPELRERIEWRNIIYTLNLAYSEMRFGRPADFREVEEKPGARAAMASFAHLPRALHPAVWTRADGQKVLHVSPWMAEGIEGAEDAAGDALLEAVCQEINAKAKAYRHQWTPTDMLIWDNWRMLHSVSGADPKYPRRMQRTTIKGDYGLGAFENDAAGHKVLEDTMV